MEQNRVQIGEYIRYDVQSYFQCEDGEGWFTEYSFENLKEAKAKAEEFKPSFEVRVVKTITKTYMETIHYEVD